MLRKNLIREVLDGPFNHCSLLSEWRLKSEAASQTLVPKPYLLHEFDRIDISCLSSFGR